MKEPDTFVLVLKAHNAGYRVGPILKLRGLVKAAFRAWGFRVLIVRPVSQEEPPTSPPAPKDTPK